MELLYVLAWYFVCSGTGRNLHLEELGFHNIEISLLQDDANGDVGCCIGGPVASPALSGALLMDDVGCRRGGEAAEED